jgi:hypothetical protein
MLGKANASELRKLGRFPPSEARKRVLLLVDGSKDFIPKAVLEATYAEITKGQGGKAVVHRVAVVYVHDRGDYQFGW